MRATYGRGWSPGAMFIAGLLVGCSSGGNGAVDSGSSVADSGTDAAVTDLGTDTAVDVGTLDTGIDAVTLDTSMDTSVADIATDTPADTGPAPCTGDTDCAASALGSVCDTTTGRCVQCVASADTCPAAQHCDPDSETCVAGCRSDDGCASATDAGVTATDSGIVSAPYCDPTMHACVQCMTDAQCPVGTVCTGEVCVPGCSTDHGCPSGQTCCGAACVDIASNVADCGGCGTVCTVPNGVPACVASACTVGMCTAPFADCDGLASNGCETYTLTAANHCGGCSTVCPAVSHAAPTCAAGACGYVCDTGYGDCDGLASNGCETPLTTTVAHCGSCGMACPPEANGSATCVGGACGVACASGYGDCDGVTSNGCETNLQTSSTNCGACGTACSAAPLGPSVCAAGQCAARSCLSILTANSAAMNGAYLLDLDGPGPLVAQMFYCDMTNGGWTMVENQVPTDPLPDTTTTVEPTNFGTLTGSWRLGNPDITTIVPTVGWKLTDAHNAVYFRPTCVVDWTMNYTNTMVSTVCTVGYTGVDFGTVVNGGWIYCSAVGIGINDDGTFCSIRADEGGPAAQGAGPHGRAYSCLYSSTVERISLWFK